MRDPKERLRDILEAISNIERYAAHGRTEFESNELIQTWFLHQFQIIGEAVRALPGEVQQLAPAIPWSKIIGMRNILVHGYFDIDTAIVWDAVSKDIPSLKSEVEHLLTRLSDVRP